MIKYFKILFITSEVKTGNLLIYIQSKQNEGQLFISILCLEYIIIYLKKHFPVIVLQEQVEKLQKDLGRSEVRARHLSSLLSEAEKDSARNLHQNKVLKEELRRLERALERQPHVANTEYLKNVIFKVRYFSCLFIYYFS